MCLSAAFLLACGVAGAQEYSLHTFVTSDGLGNLSVQKIYQDRVGFIWVSTENGLFRYDGNRFETVGPRQGIPAAAGVAFGEAPDGSLLVGASIGLYHQTGSRFEKLAVPFKTVSWTQGIETDGHGRTYLATDAGLFEMMFEPARAEFAFRRIYPAEGAEAETVYSVFPEGEAIWFGCGVKLCQMDAGQLKVFGEKSGLLNVPLAAILKDGDGNLWVRARNEGMLELPPGASRFRRPDTPVPGRVLTGTPALDRSGHMLLGTPDGLLIQGKRGWQLIDRHVGLRGGVFSAFEDRQHSLWMGTGGRGLTEWRGYREWENYSSPSGLPSDNVFELLPDADGSIWVATEAGLVHGEPHGFGMAWTVVPATSGIPVHSLEMTAAGDLWIGTASKGIARLHIRTGQVDWYGVHQGLGGKLALTIRFDRGNQLWAATEAGVFVASPPYHTFSRVSALPARWFWTIAVGADGTVWAGGTEGLFALADGRWRQWTHANGLSNTDVVSVGAASDGSAWVGYHHGGGIDRVHLSLRGAAIEHGLQRPGTDGLIYFLDFDRAGRLWAGTERGVEMWDGAHWSHYDTTDGLAWDDCDLGGFASGPDGSIWIGTGGGLSHFTPRREASSALPLGVKFTELRLGQASILSESDPSFAAASGALIATFAAPNAVQDSSLLFRYRLEGDSAAWTETARRQLEFARLAPGKYLLEVQVRDQRGVWCAQEARFAFSIRSPWYRSGWFLLALAFVPFLGAIIVSRIRSTGARKREQRLQRIVDEKTSDLRKANEELVRLTMLDALTGLANRRRFDQTLAQECERLKRSGSTVSLILIDVDHFKYLNDSAGHQKGDEYLVILARELMRTARRQIDVAARVGGEEFALILPATSAAEAAQIAESLRARVEALGLPHPASPVSASLTVSVGVATATPDRYSSPEEIVAASDQALYRAKSLGRNRVEVA